MTVRRRPVALAVSDSTSSNNNTTRSFSSLNSRIREDWSIGQSASTRNTPLVEEDMAVMQNNPTSPLLPPAYTEKLNTTTEDWISTGNTILPPAYCELSPQKLHRADRTFSGSSDGDGTFLTLTRSPDSTILSPSRTFSIPENDLLLHSSTATSAYPDSTSPSQRDQASGRRKKKSLFSRAVGGFFKWTIVVPTYGAGETDAGCTVTGDCFVASSYGY